MLHRAVGLAMALLAPMVNGDVDRRTQLMNEAVRAVAAPARGAWTYREHCMGCHGPGGLGNATEVVPALAGQREPYLLKQLIDFVEGERDTPEMHRLMARKELGDPQSWRDLTAYLSGLNPNGQPQVGDGQALATGRRVYKEVCGECHGDAGQGDVTGSIPALRGQHYSYLVLELRGFASGHRLDIELPVLEYIAGLSLAELQGVADYLSRLPIKEPETI